ncbi:hypothetical protein BDW71DRAFT_20384 [Aspergillus fruticulosus]
MSGTRDILYRKSPKASALLRTAFSSPIVEVERLWLQRHFRSAGFQPHQRAFIWITTRRAAKSYGGIFCFANASILAGFVRVEPTHNGDNAPDKLARSPSRFELVRIGVVTGLV